MRVTFTIDDDLAAEQKRLRRSHGKRFNSIVNDAFRRGLRDQKFIQPFRTRSVSLGTPKLSNIDNVTKTLAFAEGEEFK